jgi:hypothetical protein
MTNENVWSDLIITNKQFILRQIEPEHHHYYDDYINNYEINNMTHEIRNKKNHHILKLTFNNGYFQIHTGRDRYYFHKILATQYIKNPHNLKVVIHKDNNKLNNSIENLAWNHNDYTRRR